MRSDLERFFSPQSIAIIGASKDFVTISGQPLKHMLSHGYQGKLYPINPKYTEIVGLTCYPSVESLPEAPDLALILVNASRVADMLIACGEKGIPYVIIFSSGFSETGGQGVSMQQQLIDIANRYQIGVIGPNCQGMINVADAVYAGFGSIFNSNYTPGSVSMVSQSGGFGFSVMNLSSLDGKLPFRQMVTTGNEIGVSTLDFLDYFIRDPNTDIIGAYIEGVKDARRILDIGDKALAANKPILMWKVGNTEQGQKAAASHTANLGGEMALYKSAFRQKGIIQVEDIQDLVDYGRALKSGRKPKGNRLAIITISGGAGILMTDECVAGGMQLAQLAPETVEKLRQFVPSFGSLGNPVDVTAAIFNDLTLINKTLQAINDDPGVDCIAMINASLQGEIAEKVASEIIAVAATTDKPIYISWSARDEVATATYAALDAARIPHYKSPVRCGRAIAVVSWYAQAQRRNAEQANDLPLVMHQPSALEMLKGKEGDIAEYAAKRVLYEYGIPVTREVLVQSAEDGVSAAQSMGYPVVMKVQSADISHKTEAKAVCLGVGDAVAVKQAYADILCNAQQYKKDANIDGVLVQEMVAGGIEVIVGVTNDALFGPAVMFGLGGVFAEVLKDVSFRVAPITTAIAHEMIAEIKGYPVLMGARGQPLADIDALVEVLVRLSALAMDLREHVAEIDINPLIVRPQGQGVCALDALIRLKPVV